MNSYERIIYGLGLLTLLGVAASPGVAHSQESPAPGVYLLTQVEGSALPMTLWTTKPNGDRCKQEIIQGALLLDSEGRSAAFLVDRTICANDNESGAAAAEKSIIFSGSYSVSGGTLLSIRDDFGTDKATLEGDMLIYESGGEGRPVTIFVFERSKM